MIVFLDATRILFATWWLFIILLSAFYTANLTAFLTLSKFTLDIENPEDLYKKSYRWISTEGGSVQFVVKSVRTNKILLNNSIVLKPTSEEDVLQSSYNFNYITYLISVYPIVELPFWDKYSYKNMNFHTPFYFSLRMISTT